MLARSPHTELRAPARLANDSDDDHMRVGAASADQNAMDFSIIIPTYNRAVRAEEKKAEEKVVASKEPAKKPDAKTTDDELAFMAYVLSLTPVWRLEWGGLLLMHGQGDNPAQAWMPGMNLLTIFRVGQTHSVSEVTRSAAYRRHSITGWLRAEPQPE